MTASGNPPSRATWPERAISVVLVLCAVIITALVVRREFFPAPPSSELPRRRVADWQSYAAAGQRMGPAKSRVTIVEFSDFQCPFCRTLALRLDTLRQRYPNDVAVIYRHYPLPQIHPYARTAAVATECAAAQGKFQALHDALYAQQDSIGKLQVATFASRAGVPDTTALLACVRDSVTAPRIQEDVQAGDRLGITGTPGVLVNELFLGGAPTLAQLDSLVRSADR